MNTDSEDFSAPINQSSRRDLLKAGILGLAATPALVFGEASGKPADLVQHARKDNSTTPDKSKTQVTANLPSNNPHRVFEQLKRTASDEDLYRFLYAMPKGGDIHHHLGGGIFPEDWYKIASDTKRNGGQTFYTRFQITNYRPSPLLRSSHSSYIYMWMNIREETYLRLDAAHKRDFKPLSALSPKELEEWKSAIVLDLPGEGRNEFFEYHWSRVSHLTSSIHVMSELLVENMKRFSAENVSYLEIQRSSKFYRDEKGQPIPPEVADNFWKNRLEQQDALDTGVTVRWQVIILRFAGNAEQEIEWYYDYIYNHPEFYVGMNMAGREDDNRGFPRRFTKVYDRMLQKYPPIGLSIHAGEAEKPDSHIFDTLRLGATRIGHGLNLIWDEPTMQLMRHSSFLIENNLISNHLLKYVSDLSEHPFPIYLRQGIPCTLNTDDRGMWDSNFTDEFYVAVKNYNLTWEEIKQLIHNSFTFSFAESETKVALQTDFASKMKAFEKTFLATNWEKPLTGVAAQTHGYGNRFFGLSL